ncbi:hypothetical protein ES702_05809 [subsurface metagenome]
MLKEDVPVWYRFLDTWGHLFTALYYDVLLGGVWLTPTQEQDPLWVMWRANTAKRADAIAVLPNSLWIIEVARSPGLRAVGQLLVYHSLWIEDPKILIPEELILVCETVDPDLIASASRHAIRTYVMPPPIP